MKTPQAKVGRKQRHHVASWGETINGLSRQPDGRWRVIGTATRFTEPDERRAVARFRAMQRGEEAPTVHLELAAEAVAPVLSLKPTTGPDGKPTHATGKVIAPVSEQELFAWFAEQIRTRPKEVAALTGIEQIGYLSRLVKPEPLPTFAALETLWSEKFAKSAEQRRKVLAVWRDFVSTTGIKGLEDITAPVAVAYRDAVHARKTSGKSQSNTFTRIRRFLSFAKSRAVAVEELSRCLSVLSLLTPNETTTSLDPKPIDPADYKALLEACETAEDKAMILLCLNCGLYLAEVVSLKWSDFKGDNLIKHRAKTGGCVRVATLWTETKAALAEVKRRGEYVFYNYAGSPLGVKGAEKRFRKIREAAKVNVTSSQLRDGTLTAAVEANIDERACKILAGHATGIQDFYVKRGPQMVAPACAAVYAKYFGNPKNLKQSA